jgi:tetratricopeptide (TPR) repeat protein
MPRQLLGNGVTAEVKYWEQSFGFPDKSGLETALRHYWYATHLMDEQERLERARNLMETGDFESSLKAFREIGSAAQDVDTKFDCTYGELLSLIRLGKDHEARQLLRVIRKTFAEIDEALVRADEAEIELDSWEDRWDRVLPALDRMLDRYGDLLHHPRLRDMYEQVQLRRGMRLADLGRYKEALPLLEEAVTFDLPRSDGNLYHELGRCYLDSEDYERANDALTKAIKLGIHDSRAAHAHWNIAVILLRKDSAARALDELRLAEEHATSAGTSKKNIYKAMAIAFHKLGMVEDALRYAKMSK